MDSCFVSEQDSLAVEGLIYKEIHAKVDPVVKNDIGDKLWKLCTSF